MSRLFPHCTARNTMRVLLLATAGIWLLVLSACSQPAENPVDSNTVVASWKKFNLTLSEFEASYLPFWQTTHEPDSPELRARIARQLLEQDIIAERAIRMGLDAAPSIQQRVHRDHRQFIRQEYLKRTLQPKIDQPSDEAVEEAVQRQKQRYYVRQLFSLTEEGIDSLAGRLADGEDFVSLAQTTLPDPQLARAGGALGWLKWGDTDLPVEDLLFSYKNHGEITPPVQSLMGWHIFRIDSVEQQVVFGKPDPKTYEDTRARLYNRQFDWEAAHYIRDIVWSHELAVDQNMLRSVWADLAPRLANVSAQALPQALELVSETPPIDASNAVAAQVDGNPFYVRQFYDALPNLPRGYLGPNLKQALEIAIRDSLLTQEGIDAGYETAPSVIEKTNRARNGYLFSAMMASVSDSARTAGPDLAAFYESNRPLYIDYTETEVWEILMTDPDSARALIKTIHEGADFKEMARTYTLRDSLRDKAGFLGFVRSDSGPIGKRASVLLPGALYGPIITPDGASIIQTGLKVPVYHPFEAVQDRVAIDAERSLFLDTYRRLLPTEYNAADVTLDLHALSGAFGA